VAQPSKAIKSATTKSKTSFFMINLQLANFIYGRVSNREGRLFRFATLFLTLLDKIAARSPST
jgi:hypothetical protein